jgi:tetratricopeptide (TPR) repeat protein
MKAKLAFAVVLTATGLSGAQDPLAEMLRKGVVQEETNSNLDAAIRAYQAVLAQFGEERKTAATALFRLAESYRKQGKNDSAIAAYQRLVQEFADQTKLAEQSRTVLARDFKVQPPPPPPPPATEQARRAAEIRKLEAAYAERRSQLAAEQARNRQRESLEAQIKLLQAFAKSRYELGAGSPDDEAKVKLQLLELQRVLAALEERWAQDAPAARAQP